MASRSLLEGILTVRRSDWRASSDESDMSRVMVAWGPDIVRLGRDEGGELAWPVRVFWMREDCRGILNCERMHFGVETNSNSG